MASEKRLIDANALKAKLQEHHDFFVDAWRGFSKMTYATKCRVDEIDNCIAEIVNAPTVDAVEVVHGRWIPTYHTYYNRYGEHQIADEWHCSECQIYSRDEWNYCPNCCARMDLEVKDA